MEDASYCVYKHTSPSGKIYVGITKQSVDLRWQSGRGYMKHPHFWNAIQKYGWNNIQHEVLKTNLTRDRAEIEERLLIEKYKTTDPLFGYNMTFGGESGLHFTDEVRKKISQKLKAYCSDEAVRQKMSQRQMGKTHSSETKKKMSETHKSIVTDEFRKAASERNKGKRYPNRVGHKQSEETRRKISESKRGKHFGGRGRVPRPVVCVDTGIVYRSAVEAQEKTGCGFGNIYRCCNNGRGTAGGYSWQYAD